MSEQDPPIAVTVAIPVRNGARTLAEQLDALTAQDFEGEWEVVIADNGSTDGSVGIAMSFETRLPRLRVVDASARRGTSHALNAALDVARGAVFATCDADDIVAPGWLSAMARAARSWDVVGGSIDLGRLNSPAMLAIRGQGRVTRLPLTHGFLPYAIGCNRAVRTEVARALCGWREDYVGGAEDVEFSWRAQLGGFTLGFEPDALVHKRERDTVYGLARQQYSYELASLQLDRDFRHAGLAARSWKRKVRQSVWLVTRVWYLFSSPGRKGRWVKIASRNAGYYVGMLRLLFARTKRRMRARALG